MRIKMKSILQWLKSLIYKVGILDLNQVKHPAILIEVKNGINAQTGLLEEQAVFTVSIPKIPHARMVDIYAQLLLSLESGQFHQLISNIFNQNKAGLGTEIDNQINFYIKAYEQNQKPIENERDVLIYPSEVFSKGDK